MGYGVARTALRVVILLLGVASCGDGAGPDGSALLARIEVRAMDPGAVASGIVEGESHQYVATLLDSAGQEMPARPVEWTSSEPGIATVNADGIVTAEAAGRARISAEIGTISGGVFVDVLAAAASLEFLPARLGLVPGGTYDLVVIFRDGSGAQLSANGRHITWTNSSPAVASATGEIATKVTGLTEGTTTFTATGSGATASTDVDVSVVEFTEVHAGSRYSCGVTTGKVSYCWGDNLSNVLGTPIGLHSSAPIRSEGMGAATSVYPGLGSTCALAVAGDLWCWGSGGLPPQPVPGAVVFSSLAMGYSFSCGLDVDGAAWCWGYGGDGSLGTGSTTESQPTPTAVSGGRAYVELRTHPSGRTVCGLTAAKEAWCWGANGEGQVGDGTTTQRNEPTAVAGGVEFETISVGMNHACGLTAAGAAYCWGGNQFGQLGQIGASPTPSPVDGGLTFASIAAGASYTCAVATSGAGYCWGYNDSGQLGTGSSTPTSTPVAVAGGLTFSRISAGTDHACGMTVNDVVYCWGYGQVYENPAEVFADAPRKVVGQP